MKASVAALVAILSSANGQDFEIISTAQAQPAVQAVPAVRAFPAVRGFPAVPRTIVNFAATTPAIAPVAVATPFAAPIISQAVPASAVSSQFHAQDEIGNFAYGYSNINSAKREEGNALTQVTGSYSFLDANGIVQHANYISNPGLGFRVQASNLPVGPAPVEDTPEVKAAKLEFQAAFDEATGYDYEAIGDRNTDDYDYVTERSLPVYKDIEASPIDIKSAKLEFVPAAPAFAYAAAPAVVPSAPAARAGILTKIQLTPGHAVAYKVE